MPFNNLIENKFISLVVVAVCLLIFGTIAGFVIQGPPPDTEVDTVSDPKTSDSIETVGDPPGSETRTQSKEAKTFFDVYSENIHELFSPVNIVELRSHGDVGYVVVSGPNTGEDFEELERDLFEAWIDTLDYAWNRSKSWQIDHLVIHHRDEPNGDRLRSYRLEKPWALQVLNDMDNYNGFEFSVGTTWHRPDTPSYIDESQFLENTSKFSEFEVLSLDQFGQKYFLHIKTSTYTGDQYKDLLEQLLEILHTEGAKNYQNHISGMNIIVHSPNGSAVRYQNLPYGFKTLYMSGEINHTSYRSLLVSDGVWLSDITGDIEPGEVKREIPIEKSPQNASKIKRTGNHSLGKIGMG